MGKLLEKKRRSKSDRHAEKLAFEAEQNRIADLSEKYMDRHQPTDHRMVVNRDAIEKRGDVWLVVVNPDDEDLFDYNDHARAVEASMEMEDNEHIQVLFVPLLPPEDD